eukprot:CAMPEP_0182429296 /NCGR_PEP_ID=MMETSP1167-20130531/25664_1 /TAXON_ID=2988 /ORGANISM="Mallomonas Sp, Strain CCMP3275" /LENGTH=157 /DNA_ID=CAMNT_0024612731 /DNA_START=203 /DNA_END=676 /DNA_ORIENTATION=-
MKLGYRQYHAGKSVLKTISGFKIFPMPQLSPSMTCGQISKWHIHQGQHINEYDLIADVTTNELTNSASDPEVSVLEVEIQESMIVAKIFFQEGDKYIPTGTPLAILCEDERDIDTATQYEVSNNMNIYNNNIDNVSSIIWQAYLKSSSNPDGGCGCS